MDAGRGGGVGPGEAVRQRLVGEVPVAVPPAGLDLPGRLARDRDRPAKDDP
ncbi:hypothetical protein GCM10010495_29210 [Kitasatospora herbaricolor]|nr:hypothetical protein GCM10010495_29210 [Kitasatospora herbaricolor]